MDKKKGLILGALALVLVGIGAFTMLGGEEPKKESKPKSKVSKKTKASSETKLVKGGSDSKPSGEVKGVPKISDLDVNSPDSAPNLENGASKQPDDPSLASMEHSGLSPMAKRDPFAVPPEGVPAKPEPAKPIASTNSTSAPNKPAPAPMGGVRAGIAKAEALPEVAPMPVPGGPIAMGGPSADAHGKPNLKSAPAAYNENEVPFSVDGVVVGDRPVAVLADAEGNRRVVKVGARIGDGEVVRISKSGVFVRRNGKVVALKIGGGSGTVKKNEKQSGDPQRSGAE